MGPTLYKGGFFIYPCEMQDLYIAIQLAIDSNELDKALQTLNCIDHKSRNFDWYRLNGLAQLSLDNCEMALISLGKALELKPNNLDVIYSLAIAQFRVGLVDLSIKNLQLVCKKTDYNLEVTNTLIEVAISARNYKVAQDCLKKLIQKVKDPEILIRREIDLGIFFSKFEDSIASYETLQRIGKYQPNDLAHENYLRMILADWSKYYEIKQILKKGLHTIFTPSHLLSLPSNASQQYSSAKLFSDQYPKALEKYTFLPRNHPKIKVCYFSADFHNHATAYLIAELLELHYRNDFEVHCFSYGPNKNDQLRNRVKNSVDYFHELSSATDDEIIELSRNLNIDIAIDMKGYGINQRLDIFAKRVAPIQVNYLVYPGTMGTSFHDYIIADKYLIPEDQQIFYTEKVLYMDSSYQVSDQKREISPDAGTKKSWGLKEDYFIFACFNNNYKITPDIFDVWLNILLSVPNSQLWLLEDNSMAKKNLIKYAKKRHLTQDRLVFAPRVDIPRHLARHRHVDLMLDTPYYNAHTTANDALFMGVPILTVEGNTFASRVCGSLLKDVYLDDLIAQDFFNYQEKAIDLAINRQRLAGYKSHLSNKGDLPLFNIQGKVRNIEQLYKKILNRS